MARNSTVNVAILGSGNIGTDLMYKLLQHRGRLRLSLMSGIDPNSDGLARARYLGVDTSHQGVQPILERGDIELVFDATSASAHVRHAKLLREARVTAIDLTPAARGPYVVPPVNLHEHIDLDNVNLITCGGQATIPLVHAVRRVAAVQYAEMVSTVASRSAGPGTRQNIDEFTYTTARGLERIGGAKTGKAIIILNPAEPPIMMTNTVYAIPAEDDIDEVGITESVREIEEQVRKYVPGYHLKGEPVVQRRDTPWGVKSVISMMLEVEGAGDYLPKYAGNLDIMTAAARRVGELFAERLLANGEAA